MPDFWYGRGSGWAKPFRSTVRARNSYEPGARPSRRAVHGTVLKSSGQSLGLPVVGSKPQISFGEVPSGRIGVPVVGRRHQLAGAPDRRLPGRVVVGKLSTCPRSPGAASTRPA